MNKFYLSIITLSLVIVSALFTLCCFDKMAWGHMLIAILNLIIILGFSLDRLYLSKGFENETIVKQEEDSSASLAMNALEQIHSPTITNVDWSKAMYELFNERWNELFDNIEYPIENKSMADINILCWEIASRTMDYLLVDNDDPNVLVRNRESVDAVVTGKKLSEQNLKEFFDDPSTVPAKVIGVHDTLVSQMSNKQKNTTQIFGYLVELTSKDE